jgi:hypothetical protein
MMMVGHALFYFLVEADSFLAASPCPAGLTSLCLAWPVSAGLPALAAEPERLPPGPAERSFWGTVAEGCRQGLARVLCFIYIRRILQAVCVQFSS